jgi:hypothetical protein
LAAWTVPVKAEVKALSVYMRREDASIAALPILVAFRKV